MIIKTYNEGINAVITLVKDMNSGLSGQIVSLNGEITILKIENQKLNDRITELEARLNKNSSNSSKPPSSDGYKKPSNNRGKSGKPTGGQPGHEGKTLEKTDDPDEVIDLKPRQCECGCDLSSVKGTISTRQVFEMPIIEVKVTEYRSHKIVCPDCNKVHTVEFPETVTQPVQYGENMQAFMSYLTEYQLLPLERATEIIRDITGQTVSEGTLVNVNNRIHDNLEGTEVSIKQQLIDSEVVHFDESGVRCEGKNKWMHSASTDELTHYAVHEKRGAKAGHDIGILPEYAGTAVHDHWKPYYTFKKCSHAECNAHHIRNLKGIYEDYGQEWAQDMAGLLVEIKKRVDVLKVEGAISMDVNEMDMFKGRYHNIIISGMKEDALMNAGKISEKTGKPKKSKAFNLLVKLQTYDVETLSFMYDFNIPFSNNQAERDIRMVKLKQKISGGFRDKAGADAFCRIRSYISTCRKNGQSVIDSLIKAVKGEPFIPQTR